jgi:ABC-2 type transport system permease protein
MEPPLIMSDATNILQAPHNPPVPRRIRGVNWIGLQTLVKKEVGRFLAVYTQTIVAPVITTLLYYTIFALAFGKVRQNIGDVSYMEFLAPGLVMMSMVQNAFANTSSSMVISKVQGNIVDVLIPPLSATELYIGYIAGGVIRGLAVGLVSTVVIALFVPMHVYSLSQIIVFSLLGTMMLASLGLAGGIWSQKFDHIAAVTNFIVTPLTFLSGTFYSIRNLPPAWRAFAHINPFFHMIDGFRSGFIGQSDGSPLLGVGVLIVANVLLAALCLWMLKTGYKIKS